jgi:ATP-dependent RNA helicase RhlB
MNFIQRVKAAFNGKKGSKSAPEVPANLRSKKKPHAKKPHRGPRFIDEAGKAVEPAKARGGPHKKRGPHHPPAKPHGHHGPGKAKKPLPPWDPNEYQVPEEEGKTRFQDLDLSEPLLHALSDLNFRYCTPIQAKSLPLSLDGVNVSGRAQTGTGKTAAFLLTIFKYLLQHPAKPDRRKGYPRALIMAPTRELCMQIARDAEDLGKYTGLRTLAVYGGMDLQAQRSVLREKHVDVIVATPGRLLDFRQRQDVEFSKVEVLVIDEADRMLDMGFIPDMRRIVYGCPPKQNRQTMLFSATLTPEVTRLASQWMHNPVTVNIENATVAADTIDQRVYIVTGRQKFTIVYNILQDMKPERVIIFGNRRDTTEQIAENLKNQGLSVALLSGAVDQRKRVKVLDNFRSGDVPIMVATDVAGRGLHIDGIDLIINFNVPEQAEDYVHRIGRTGRVGEKGISITFADELDSYYIPAVEEYMKQPLKCIQPPEEWLEKLPQAMLAAKRRPRPAGGGFGGRGGSRGGPRGGGRGGPRRR